MSESVNQLAEKVRLARKDPASAGIYYATQESWDAHNALLDALLADNAKWRELYGRACNDADSAEAAEQSLKAMLATTVERAERAEERNSLVEQDNTRLLNEAVESGDRQEAADLGWHVISGEDFLQALHRVDAGEDADAVYAELWANAEHSRP